MMIRNCLHRWSPVVCGGVPARETSRSNSGHWCTREAETLGSVFAKPGFSKKNQKTGLL